VRAQSGDGHDFPGLVEERVRGAAAVVDNIVEGFENTVRQQAVSRDHLSDDVVICEP
jgi:hypothetical protein